MSELPEKEEEREPFTIRLHLKTARGFKELLKRPGGEPLSISDGGEAAIKLWIQKETEGVAQAQAARKSRQLHKSLQKILVSAVTNQLRSNREWAEAAVNASSLQDPVVSTYLQRVDHFYEEKKFLSKVFVPWLVRRILFFLSGDCDICLVVESGTTLKAIMDDLGPALAREITAIKQLENDRLLIVTNNFPGAESYEAVAGATAVDARGTLSDVVPSHLVPGKALREYSAVVGPQAQRYLTERCTHVPERKRKLVRIGLVVGNWVMLEGKPARPTPLARGAGHKSFKEVLLNNCDEIYLITPLCKIIRAFDGKTVVENLSEFNRDLLGVSPGEKGHYERVDISGLDDEGRRPFVALPRPSVEISDRLKVVTTERANKQSIMHTYSAKVSTSLGVEAREEDRGDVGLPIEKISHFLYRFDDISTLSTEEQLEIELPHEDTRTPSFKKKYFRLD